MASTLSASFSISLENSWAVRVKFIVISCLLVGLLGDPFSRTAQLFSKEIENDADNVDAILDAAYEVRALADDHLLGMLRMRKED